MTITWPSTEKTYHYGVNVSSADGYMVLLDFNNNYLTNREGQPILPFTSVGGPPEIGWGWGVQATGIDYPPLPYGVKVRFFSIAENQFWEGETGFDQTKLQQLNTYTVNDIIYRTKNPFLGSFDFIVNYAPQGLVTIWISGEGEIFLLTQFKAKKVEEKNWMQFVSAILPTENNTLTREKYLIYQLEGTDRVTPYAVLSEKIKKEIAEHRLPSSAPWLRLMNTYPWVLTTNDEYPLKDYKTRYVNGELYYTYKEQDQYQLAPRAVPYELVVYFENKKTNELKRADLYFDQEQMIQAFEKLNKSLENTGPIKLHLNIDDDLTRVDVYVIRGKESVEVDTTRAELVKLYNN